MMLIRSQDKKILTSFTHVNTYGPCRGRECYIIECGMNVIGEYSSKEKAMKVLDMIEAKYLEPTYINCVAENEYAKYERKVFQMPQDEEVIV